MIFVHMFWGQQESTVRLRRLLRVLAIGTVLCMSGAGYGLWSAQAGLAAAQASVRSLKRQTADLSRTLRAKRERMAQTQPLQSADPQGVGSMQFTDEMSRMTHAAGVQIGTCHITALDAPPPPAAVPAANAPRPEANGAASAPQPANAANGPSPGTPAPKRKSRWSQAIFDYEFLGSFHALTTLLQQMAVMPRIIEIDSFDLSRSQLSGPQASVIVRLRITGTLYGLPETGSPQ